MQNGEKILTSKIGEHKGKVNVGTWAWLFVLPAIVVYSIFGWYPTASAFWICLQKFKLFGPNEFVGFYNFKMILIDPRVIISVRNTFYFTALSLTLIFLVPIFVAILLMEMSKGVIRIMMILWFIPVASMASVILWKWIYNPQYGLLNGILEGLGLPKLMWLQDPNIAMLCLVLPGLILYGPGLIYIASLQSIPNELYEAAELEGAKFWQKIWCVTLPRLRPVISVMLILAIIGNMQVFTQPYVLTYGGPGRATISVVMAIYITAFKEFKMGKATAVSVILFFIIMALVVIQHKYFKENIDV